ncbi:MAG: YbaN family protein [Pseudomonadales bacterium]|nr:YbaN family protein [Pseudomonadales bacterium]
MTEQGKKIFFVTVGTLAVALGVIGVALPVLPTTPFLLVAAACYARSSERLYERLLADPVFGPYIREWREHRTIPRRAKFSAIGLIVLSFSLTIFLVLDNIYGQVSMALLAVAVSTWLLLIPSRD